MWQSFLEALVVRPATQQRYKAALARFRSFVADRGLAAFSAAETGAAPPNASVAGTAGWCGGLAGGEPRGGDVGLSPSGSSEIADDPEPKGTGGSGGCAW